MNLLYTLLRFALLILFAVLVLAWHQRNAGVVVIDYFQGDVQLPLSIALLLALALGVGCGLLAGGWRIWWLRRKNRRLHKRIAGLEKIPVVSSRIPGS